jgi:pyruvate dehydrogenase E1 component alpha subunit
MFHLSGGNEEELIEIFKEINPEDWVFSTHRSHYHSLLKGMPTHKLISEVIRGKSMHMYDADLKLFTSSIVGGVLPIALGVALTNKLNNKKEMVWVFVGDMCSRMGIFYECVNYAVGHDLPIIFIVEDNGYCINSKTDELWGINKPEKSKTFTYKYERKYPHSGTGEFVDFNK